MVQGTNTDCDGKGVSEMSDPDDKVALTPEEREATRTAFVVHDDPYLPPPYGTGFLSHDDGNHPLDSTRQSLLEKKRALLHEELKQVQKSAEHIETDLEALDRESICYERGFHDPQINNATGDFARITRVHLGCLDCGAVHVILNAGARPSTVYDPTEWENEGGPMKEQYEESDE
jgi:hypothetical protein